MSESSEAKLCPTCGNEIPPHAPGGLCPRCILEGAAEEGLESETLAATRTAARLAMEPPSLEEIREAFPQFEIIELIGSGGMGAVFKVRQPKLDRLVALKVLPKSLAGDERFAERFIREARALAKLNHPNIVAVHDFGEAEPGGFHFLLMEFVEGANLREAMRAGRFTPEQAFEVVPEICAALQYAHEEGVLHRDIKPENLLLDIKGRVKIVDFGIAKLVGAEVEAPLTGSYAPGTPQYMAPEQIEHPADVDHRADIYSLGVVFYEMLTGELPIGRFAAPSEKAQVGGQVDDIVFRTLEKEPGRRQQSAGEVKTQVEGIDQPKSRPVSEQDLANADSFRHHASGHSAQPRRAGRALLILASSVVAMLIVWGISIGVVHSLRAKEMQQKADANTEAAKAAKKAAELALRAHNGRSNGLPDDVIEVLEQDAVKSRTEVAQIRNIEKGDVIGRGVEVLLLTFLVISIAAILLIAIYVTRVGWRDLRTLRQAGAVGQPGTILSMIAALLLPVLLLSLLIFTILVFPARGQWTGPAMSLSAICMLGASAWLILRTWRWAKTSPSADEVSAWENRQRKTDSPGQKGKRGRGLLTALLAVFILGPVLLIGTCVVWVTASYESNAKRDAEQARSEANKAMEMARALEVGKDLSTQERQMIGSWSFDQGLDAGMMHFSADRKWRMNTADRKLTMEGTWKISDGVLENTVIRSSESESKGTVIRSEILELVPDSRLRLRDLEGGDLLLRPIYEMSDIEKSLLGGWQLEGLPGGPDADEVVFGRLHFWTDRSWAIDGKVMDESPSKWKVLDRTLVLTAANEQKKFDLRCDILLNTAHQLNLRRLDTGEELNYLRSASAPRQPLEVEVEAGADAVEAPSSSAQ